MNLNSKITYREVGDGIIIITPWDNAMHVLEDVSKDIFNFILKEKTKDEILKEILSIYDIEVDIAKKDLDEFISELTKKEIIL